MADVLGKKISELAETTDLAGLFTIGSDKNNQSKKVSLQFVKEAADYANAQGDYAKGVGDTIQGNTGMNEYPAFSSSTQYAAGSVVRYNNKLYRFTALHPAGAWVGTDAIETSIKAETDVKLTELESDVNSINLRLFDAPFVGQGSTIVSKYIRFVPGRKYRIDVINPGWSQTGLSVGNTVLGISKRVDGVRTYDVQVFYGNDADPVYYIDAVKCDSNNMYTIAVRAEVGVEVYIKVLDITESEHLSSEIGGQLYESSESPVVLSDKIDGIAWGNPGDVVQTQSSNYNNHVEFNIAGQHYINVATMLSIGKNTRLTAFVVVNSEDVILHREYFPNEENYRRNISVSIDYEVPEGADRILVQSSISSAQSVTITPLRQVTIKEQLSKMTSTETNVSNGLTILQGELQSDGSILPNGKLTTSLIPGAFMMQTTPDVIIERVVMCRHNGEIINYDIISPAGPTDTIDWQSLYGAVNDKTYFGIANDMPNVGYRLILAAKDGGSLSVKDRAILKYIHLDDKSLHSTIEKTSAMYQVMRRSNQMMRVQWECLGNIPQTLSDYFRNTFFKSGQTFISLPYSQAEENAKMLLFDVSLRTFVTSLYNPHSLMNTENISKNKSKSRYGITYNGTNCATYYGNVCSGYICWLLGLRGKVFTQQFPLIPGMRELEQQTAMSLQPGTILLNDHHCMFINDVLVDDYGNRKIIIMGEMTTPGAKLTPYTPERLQSRLDTEQHRYFAYEKWTENINENLGWNGDEMIALTDAENYSNGHYEHNDDICTFAGDYATFGLGDLIYLNVNNKGIYDSIELYKNDVLINTINLPTSEDDWFDIDLTPYNLGYGQYKARVVNAENSSDFTYWEVLDTDTTFRRSGGKITAEFTSSNCKAWSICICQISGQYYDREVGPIIRNVTEEENAAKKIETEWSNSQNDAYVFLKFKGQYGVALKKVKCSLI